MGGIASRLDSLSLNPNRRRSQQEEPLYSYSLNKNYFSNYFWMGGERFEVKDPDYLFGDNCDLNFLSCAKPYSLPYRKAQQNLLANLNMKQKCNSKVSSRCSVSRLASPLNILTGRHRQVSQCHKQDAQTQTLGNPVKGLSSGLEPSQPLVMLINIRKETLRLVNSSNVLNIDSDQNSLSPNTHSPIQHSSSKTKSKTDNPTNNDDGNVDDLDGQIISSQKTQPLIRDSLKKLANQTSSITKTKQSNHTSTKRFDDNDQHPARNVGSKPSQRAGFYKKRLSRTSDTMSNVSSPLSTTSHSIGDADDTSSTSSSFGRESIQSSKSGGYRSVRDQPASEDDDDKFEDALNDTANLSSSSSKDEADENERAQQQRSLLVHNNHKRDGPNAILSTKENRDIRISIGPSCDDREDAADDRLAKTVIEMDCEQNHHSHHRGSKDLQLNRSKLLNDKLRSRLSHRIYNIEFQFDCEVDCSIRIFYFCTREVSQDGVTYKPQHATYKSKSYIYKKGLSQKFDQQEHTFQPYLFDEDLLIYKPLDLEGNYNSGAVFPIVIHCVALDGPQPRQSQSLVATVEKSQLDESYSIKPLKQLIFVDGVQYILQDIYGIENKNFPKPPLMSTATVSAATKKPTTRVITHKTTSKTTHKHNRDERVSVSINGSVNDLKLFSDTASIASGRIIDGGSITDNDDDESSSDRTTTSLSTSSSATLAEPSEMERPSDDDIDEDDASTISISTNNQQFKSLNSENNSFECVICMSEERDTMLLPCRHLCLCSSCAQSLRYQANSCPICRCPFKAALSLRIMQTKKRSGGRRSRGRGKIGGISGAKAGSSNNIKGRHEQRQQQRRRNKQQALAGEATITAAAPAEVDPNTTTNTATTTTTTTIVSPPRAPEIQPSSRTAAGTPYCTQTTF